jgi:hypothetical protein
MATFFQKLLGMPNRTVKIGSASAESNIAFPFSKNPVELSEVEFNLFTRLATKNLAENTENLSESTGFDVDQVNEYCFYLTVEKATRMKWFLQSFRFNEGQVIKLVEVVGYVDESKIMEGAMALVKCRIVRYIIHSNVVWSNGVQYVPPFNDKGIAQFVYSYVHHNFSWKDHKENLNIVGQMSA